MGLEQTVQGAARGIAAEVGDDFGFPSRLQKGGRGGLPDFADFREN